MAAETDAGPQASGSLGSIDSGLIYDPLTGESVVLDEPIEHELNTSGRACPELQFRGQHIKCAIIGLPNAGKTAIFNLLTGCNEVESETMYSTIEPCMGICTIPDPRFDWLVSRHNPKVATPVRMTMMDGPALVRGSHHKVVGSIAGGIDFLHKFVRPLSDLLMLVVRSFDDGDLTHFEESVDPVRDCMTLLAELKCVDLFMVEEKLHVLEKLQAPTRDQLNDITTLHKCWEVLTGITYGDETRRYIQRSKHLALLKKGQSQPRADDVQSGYMLRDVVWSEQETRVLQRMQFVTIKPYVVVSTVSSRDYVRTQELTKWAPTLLERAARLKTADGGFGRVPIVSLSVPFERALRKVHASGPKKYSRFISANPRHQSGLPNLFRESLQVLSLVRCFTLGELGQSYTIGKEEVREWLFPDEEGIVAVAGRLDIEFHRYFQFALVVTYDDLHQVDGDMLDIRSENKLQQQGKAYLIGDGDIIDCSECKPGKRRLTR